MSDFPNDDSLEEDGAAIEASSEMEEALRDATEAVEARQTQGEQAADEAASPDKLTIELLSQELQGLKGLYEEKLKEFEDQNEQFLRLQAEFENFRRRGLKEKQESFKFGHQNLVKDLLLGALAKHGVKEIEAEGQIFDPADHEAMGQIPNSEVPPNTVLQVLQKGYVIHDRMLRPARVIVSREATPEEAGSRGGE